MIWLLFILVPLSICYFFLKRHHGYLEKLPFPMEKPFLCFGSPPFNWHELIHHQYYLNAFKRYKTKTFTRYAGSTPTLVTIDPEIIKQVTIKQFSNFPKSLNFDVQDKNLSLDVAHGPLWKLLRKELSPVFTSGKLKGMMEPVSEIADQFISYIEANNQPGKNVFVKDMFQGLTLDIINACAYGIKTNSRTDPDHYLLKSSKKMLENAVVSKNWGMDLFFLLFALFPEMMKLINVFGSEYDKLIEVSNSIMHQREKGSIQKKDFINVLIEMRKKKWVSEDSLLNDDIITAQAVLFFIAGYATTSMALCSLIYTLATNPEIQDKLYAEVCMTGDEDGQEEFNEKQYVSAVIKETLRMHPPATLHVRVCTKDTIVEGIPIKTGMMVEMPIYASHFDTDFFPEPHEFRPERFLEEGTIIPNTYRPFGDGNRVCIAYRFAMMELKLIIEKIVRKFKILPTSHTKMVHKKGVLFLIDVEDVGVELVPRN